MAIFLKENIALGSKLGIWKKEESLELLESVYILNNNEKKEYNLISNISRKKEWLTTRILLTELLQKKIEINHNIYGSPFLINHNSNISISHSKDFVAIIISSKHIAGIDVETISERVYKVKRKFLTTNELKWCKNLNQQTACWCAKESVFKIYMKELDFFDIKISSFILDNKNGNFKAEVLKNNKSFIIKYKIIENNIITYTFLKE